MTGRLMRVSGLTSRHLGRRVRVLDLDNETLVAGVLDGTVPVGTRVWLQLGLVLDDHDHTRVRVELGPLPGTQRCELDPGGGDR